MSPSSIALFSPNTGPPTSRTVVKPRISVSARLDAGGDVIESDIAGDRLNGIGPYQHRMPVCVDQAGIRMRSPIACNHSDARLRRRLARSRCVR